MNTNLPIQPEPRDPKLEALLTEALSPRQTPGGVPRDLVDRIVAATAPAIRRKRGVLARWGELWWPRALAATVVAAASLGVVMTILSIFQDAREWISLSRDLPVALERVHDRVSASPALAVISSEAGMATDFDNLGHSLDQAITSIERGIPAEEPTHRSGPSSAVPFGKELS